MTTERKKPMFTAIRYRVAVFFALLGGISLAGCSGADECEAPDCPEVVMSFRIITCEPGASSRAAVIGEESGTAAENWIDPSSLRFLLLTDGGMLLRDLTPEQFAPTADYGAYTIRTVSFREPYFDHGAVGGRVRFRIMVLANWPDNALKALSRCRGQVEIETATANSAALYLLPADFSPTLPTADAPGRGIPMYGLKTFDLSQKELFESTELDPVDLTNADAFHLLRALSKLEIMDDIKPKDASGYPRVISATVLQNGYRRDARLIPDAFADGRQVTAASLPAGKAVSPAGDLRFALRSYGDYVPPVVQYPETGDPAEIDYDCFTAYLPEMTITPNEVLRVVVENAPGSNPATATYTVAIPTSAEWGTELLRNHIYRLNVTGAGTDLHMEYTYTICPWNTASGEVEFN